MKNTANPEQLKAVTATDGPVLIIAGPGSGKTFTLVERVFYLLIEKAIPPENIFISTFTEKASKELISRISTRVIESGQNINVNALCIGTLHSIFLNILEEFRDYTRLKRNYVLLDGFDQQYTIYKKIYSFTTLPGADNFFKGGNWWTNANRVAKIVSTISEENIDVEELRNSGDSEISILADIYETYEELLEENNALDFSTIQKLLLELLTDRPEVLKKLRERFKYFMIDEYQDTNYIQEQILFKLLNKDKNICVVGDEDQGLYRFRGATIRNILEFENNFAGKCKRIELTKNYRSHSGIIDFYNAWMKEQDWRDPNNSKKKYRFDKVVVSGKDLKKETKYKSVVKVSGNGQEAWRKEVVSFLKDMKYKGVIKDWNQVVFLFKSVQNPNAVELAQALEEEGIRVYSPRSRMFFDREEIMLAIGALCILYKDYLDLSAIYDPDFRGYLEASISLFKEELKKDKDMQLFFKRKIRDHAFISSKSLDYSFSGLFYQLLQFPVFAKHLESRTSDDVHDTRSARNLAILTKFLTKFEYLENTKVLTAKFIEKTTKKFFDNYLSLLYNGGIEEYVDDVEYAPSGCVSFMTIHQSKGLEFPIVFVCSLWEIPRKQYTKLDEDLQKDFYNKKPFEPIEQVKYYDFMRLYYTAYSRAQNLLCLSCPERVGHEIPSKYFANSYSSLPSWKEVKERKSITLDKIKPSNLKNEYSFTSDIIVYENCPVQYSFFKELEFAPVRQGSIVFGTLVHQTIEDIHKAVLKGERDKVTEERITDWFNRNYEEIKKKEHIALTEEARKSAVKQVIRYAEREKDRWDRLHEVEVEVSFMEKGYILKGKVDLIRNENGKLDIVDFKAEKKPDINSKQGKEKLEKYRRQLHIYAHIIENKYQEKVDNMLLYYTASQESETPYIPFSKNSLAIEQTIEKVSAVVRKIEAKDYSVKERKELQCRECDMRHYCDRHLVCK